MSPWDSIQRYFNLTMAQVSACQNYDTLLLKWQAKVNLISPYTIDNRFQRHYKDCLQLLPLLPQHGSVLDIGTGAGFPGFLIAVTTSLCVTCVEKDGKKAAFLEEAARICETEITILPLDINNISPNRYDVITSRACASLEQLLEWSYPYMHGETICLFPKGKNFASELLEAEKNFVFHVKQIPSQTDPLAHILLLQKVCRK